MNENIIKFIKNTKFYSLIGVDKIELIKGNPINIYDLNLNTIKSIINNNFNFIYNHKQINNFKVIIYDKTIYLPKFTINYYGFSPLIKQTNNIINYDNILLPDYDYGKTIILGFELYYKIVHSENELVMFNNDEHKYSIDSITNYIDNILQKLLYNSLTSSIRLQINRLKLYIQQYKYYLSIKFNISNKTIQYNLLQHKNIFLNKLLNYIFIIIYYIQPFIFDIYKVNKTNLNNEGYQINDLVLQLSNHRDVNHQIIRDEYLYKLDDSNDFIVLEQLLHQADKLILKYQDLIDITINNKIENKYYYNEPLSISPNSSLTDIQDNKLSKLQLVIKPIIFNDIIELFNEIEIYNKTLNKKIKYKRITNDQFKCDLSTEYNDKQKYIDKILFDESYLFLFYKTKLLNNLN